MKGENVFNIDVYPNPANTQVVISYENPESQKINIEMLDVNGKIIKTIFQGMSTKGKQTVIFEMPAVSNGMYFISVDNNSYKNVKTIFVE